MALIYQQSPVVMVGDNQFINCPTIIQVEDIPLMQMGRYEPAGFTTKFAVYHNDGTKIAVVKGSQIYPTEEGVKASITLRHEPNLTACELEGRTIFELRRQGAAALRGAAELYAPEGIFVKASDSSLSANLQSGAPIGISGLQLTGCIVEDMPIGIHVTKSVVAISTSGGPYSMENAIFFGVGSADQHIQLRVVNDAGVDEDGAFELKDDYRQSGGYYISRASGPGEAQLGLGPSAHKEIQVEWGDGPDKRTIQITHVITDV